MTKHFSVYTSECMGAVYSCLLVNVPLVPSSGQRLKKTWSNCQYVFRFRKLTLYKTFVFLCCHLQAKLHNSRNDLQIANIQQLYWGRSFAPYVDVLTWETLVNLTLVSSLRRFFTAEASSCSAASCFSLSSSCFFRMATGSPFWVAWKTAKIKWVSQQVWHAFSELSGACTPQLQAVNRCLFLTLFFAVSHTMCQVSWMMPTFSDRISMSLWASPSLNTMLLMVDTRAL